jgi:hypothetical protein
MTLDASFRGQPAEAVCKLFDCEPAELEELQRAIKLSANRVQRFCAEVR